MDGRSEFFVYMGAAIGTSVMLFVAQQVYASYLDVHVVHAAWNEAGRDAKVVAKREAEKQALSGGKMPIDKAIEALAQRGRGASNSIAPVASDDLSAMSGWAFRHGFAAYQPRTIAAPPSAPAPTEGSLEGQPASAQPQPVGAVPAPAAAPEGAKPVTSGTLKVDSNAPSTAAHATH